VPKVEEFYPSRASGSNDHLKEDERHAAHTPRKRVRCGSACASGLEAHGLEALRERHHNFRHFRSFLILAHLL